MNPPPNFKLTRYGVDGFVLLPIWKDFQVENTAFYARQIKENPTGEVRISFHSDAVFPKAIVMEEQMRAYEYLLENSEEIYTILLTKLLDEYENLKGDFGYYDFDDGTLQALLMPPVEKFEDFKPLIELESIFIATSSKDGFANVGYYFLCSWDDEHGLGFWTNKNEIIEFGGSGIGM